MVNRIKIFRLFILQLALLASSCKTTEFGFNVIDVSGMVYDFSNRPVPHYEISLGKKYKGSTDINGRFTLSKVPAGKYGISGSKSGFENYSGEVNIRERGQILYIRIPSQSQLLDMTGDALAVNNLILAEEMAERAFRIDENNTETLFYCAAVSFRQRQFDKAAAFLETSKNLGLRDVYIDKFLTVLKELQYENKTR